MSDPRAIGKAGEYRIASELLMRGYNPMIASVDNGVDLVLENGKTIQVKTTTKACYGDRGKSTKASLATTRYIRGDRTHEVKDNRADFYIIWVIPWDSFFIIPRDVIKMKGISLSFTVGKPDGLYRFKDCWNLLKG